MQCLFKIFSIHLLKMEEKSLRLYKANRLIFTGSLPWPRQQATLDLGTCLASICHVDVNLTLIKKPPGLRHCVRNNGTQKVQFLDESKVIFNERREMSSLSYVVDC